MMVFVVINKNTTSKAIDRTTEFDIKIAEDNVAMPKDAFVELMATAERQGSVTSEAIAEIQDTEELPVEAELSWPVGEE